jgi:hypothetical protein
LKQLRPRDHEHAVQYQSFEHSPFFSICKTIISLIGKKVNNRIHHQHPLYTPKRRREKSAAESEELMNEAKIRQEPQDVTALAGQVKGMTLVQLAQTIALLNMAVAIFEGYAAITAAAKKQS